MWLAPVDVPGDSPWIAVHSAEAGSYNGTRQAAAGVLLQICWRCHALAKQLVVHTWGELARKVAQAVGPTTSRLRLFASQTGRTRREGAGDWQILWWLELGRVGRVRSGRETCC